MLEAGASWDEAQEALFEAMSLYAQNSKQPKAPGTQISAEWLNAVAQEHISFSVTPKANRPLRSFRLKRTIPQPGDELRIVDDHEPVIAHLVRTAQNYGLRFDERKFTDREVERLNDHVAILRGRALKLFDLLYKRVEKAAPGKVFFTM
jgi:hypothetical protein